jgi:AcrR family transcriptional regulator
MFIQPPGVINRVDRKKEQTKQKIITVALSLFRQNGFAVTTMEQIAGAADIAKGTLYNYFPVKEAIVDEYIKRSFKDRAPERLLQLQKLPDTRLRLVLMLGELIEKVQAQKVLFEKYMIYRMQQLLALHQEDSEKSGLYLEIREIIRLGQLGGEIRTDLPAAIIEDLFDFIFVEAAKQFYLNAGKFNAQQTIERCVDLFMNGVKPPDKKV